MKFLKNNFKNIVVGFLLILAAGNIIVWQAVLEEGRKPDMEVYFYDVGQGDSALIQTRDGTQILIDGGPNSQILALLGKSMPFYDNSIDAVILSHPHRDHLAGLIEVLKRYEVGAVFESGVMYETTEAKEFRKAVIEAGIKSTVIDSPSQLSFFEGAELKFIFPNISFEGKEVKNINETSLVATLEYKDVEILFTGDIGEVTERELIKKGVLRDIDILKVGHQGSKYSSSLNFLKKIAPEYAVIPVGRNSYGHPHPDAINRLASVGAKILRTDTNGTIKIEIRGSEFAVFTDMVY